MSYKVDALAKAASMVLYKFSEGEEDWDEWQQLADALTSVIPLMMDEHCTEQVERRTTEFQERLQKGRA
ncbi:MAG: hypothetical protein ACYS7Y_11970 [Planctomycetota bacterium]|jgi:hypothetical protein